MATVQEIEQRRAKRREDNDKARADQEVADLEAIDALEAASDEPLHTLTTNRHKPGIVVRVGYRAPSAAEYKRYHDMVGRAQQKGDSKGRIEAQEMLGASCCVYPDKDSDAYKALREAFPGLLISLAIECAKLAELRSEEEGKG